MTGIVVAICLSPSAGSLMKRVPGVQALAGLGLEGDRYAKAEGSFNRANPGKRQVTLMNSVFFENSGFDFEDSRRNIFVRGTELMWLIGRDFKLGNAVFRGIKYCDPCKRPEKLSGKTGFEEKFHDRGGLVAEIIDSGWVTVDSLLIPPPKGY